MLTVGSLFSGIGGFDLGLERAGFTISWQVEIDPYCQRVLAKHWPTVPRYGDIRAVDWGAVEPVDLLCGGFPCQDLSFAGKRTGIDGARSGLWSEYVRAIVSLRPRYVIVENVPGLLTNQYMGRVLGDLAESGYDAEWDCISASAIGANHRRDRVWIIAYAQGDGTQGRIFQPWRNAVPWTNGFAQSLADSACQMLNGSGNARASRRYEFTVKSSDVSDAASGSEQSRRPQCDEWRFRNKIMRGVGHSCHWEVEPAMGELVDGVSGGLVRFDGRVTHTCKNRIHKLRGLGNAVVPQIVEALGRMILTADRRAG